MYILFIIMANYDNKFLHILKEKYIKNATQHGY